ncbi:MAG: hypothetical protein MK193_15170 [Lentisphaeria bacterium]|nr:hypothetical protein [Lentisphaeria bacterium]
MAMFDIEDSKDVELDGNKTTKETLAKVKNVEGLKAKNNEAGQEVKTQIPNEDVLELKPNFMGFGINLRSLWRKFVSKKT